jgi:hypothetical protein
MAEELKPNVAESKYTPLNLEEFQQLKAQLESVKSYLPEHLMGPFWSWCNRIRGEKINQPCSCKSSARLWGDCVETLRTFVRDRSE